MFSGLACFMVLEGLAAVSIAVRQGRPSRAVMGSDIRSYGLTFLGLVPMAWLMAFAY